MAKVVLLFLHHRYFGLFRYGYISIMLFDLAFKMKCKYMYMYKGFVARSKRGKKDATCTYMV